MQRQTVCLDFDGVLNDYTGDFDAATKPLDGAQDFINGLAKLKYDVVILSSRPADEIKKWLQKHKIDGVDEVTNEKVPAEVYVDDRAIRFNGDYVETLKEIKNFKPWYDETQKERVMPGPGHERTSKGTQTAKQWGSMQAARKGTLRGIGPSKEVAEEFISKTPRKKRKSFARALANNRS